MGKVLRKKTAGEYVDSMKIKSTNPSKNYQPLGEVECSTLQEVQEKVAAAHKAKKAWHELGLEGR